MHVPTIGQTDGYDYTSFAILWTKFGCYDFHASPCLRRRLLSGKARLGKCGLLDASQGMSRPDALGWTHE